jgi:hypothetical protein
MSTNANLTSILRRIIFNIINRRQEKPPAFG